MKNSSALATFLAERVEKENIISEVFKLFQVDCIARCQLNPSFLDGLIKRFNESDFVDVEVLEEIITFIKSEQKDAQSKEKELLQRIKAYVCDTLTEDISIEEIADRLHISYYYMCHIFKDNFNESLSFYRTKKRLEKAMRLLAEGESKVSDIASLCGYNNISYFTEVFTKNVGVSPTEFRKQNSKKCFHSFNGYDDMRFISKTDSLRFLKSGVEETEKEVWSAAVCVPDDTFKFLHEAAIIEYHNVLYASWYHCREKELHGYTPICGKRSFDGGETWSDLEIICDDKSERILYCPPVYGICDGKLYMLVNQMVAPDHIHSLDLYVLNNETDRFEQLWTRPIPFKLNTNVVALPNGKLMLPGRVGELDGFPNTPAVLISDSGKIDDEWRLVKIAEDGTLCDGSEFIHPEISVICAKGVLYMFCRNDQRFVPLVYVSEDFGETWSDACSHDVPLIPSKIYCGDLKCGRHYMICNADKLNRSKLAVYFTDDVTLTFTKRLVLTDCEDGRWGAMHYPAACEYDGYLYVIATEGYKNGTRGARLFKINLGEI